MPQISEGSEKPVKGGMLVTRKSIVSGLEYSIVLPINATQLNKWRSGELIQDAMPNLTADQREFLLTGITAEEWEKEFGDEDDKLC